MDQSEAGWNVLAATGKLRLANVEFAGHMRGAELERAIAGSRFTVLPSHAYEILWARRFWSLTLRGAGRGGYGSGIAAGTGAELARLDSCTGWAMWNSWRRPSGFSAAHNLNWRTKWGKQDGSRCGSGSTPEAHYEALIDLYERVIDEKKQSAGAPRGSRTRRTPRDGNGTEAECRGGNRGSFSISLAAPCLWPCFG